MIMMMMMMVMKMVMMMVVVVVVVGAVIAWEARLCYGGKRQKKPSKIGSLSSPIFYFAHADFFSPFTPMQSLIPGYGGGGGGDPSVVCI